MRVLLTGASSMIGRATVERLLARGDEVSVLQRRHAGLDQHARLTEHLLDLADPASAPLLERLLAGHDAVVHLAAKVGVTGGWEAFEAVNIEGTKRLLHAARSGGVVRFVHVSSPSVAHTGSALVGAPAGPADPEHTRGHYATSKAIGERWVLEQHRTAVPQRTPTGTPTTLSVVALRPHLVWGPGDQQLVARIVERAQQGRLAFVGSGMGLIDTTYVDNAASAIVAGLDRVDAPEVGGRAFVISNGQPRTVQELVGQILRAAGVSATQRHVPFRLAFTAGRGIEAVWERRGINSDPPMTSFLAEQLGTAHWFDQQAVRTALQWAPEVSIEEGFDRLTAWFAAENADQLSRIG